MSMNLWIFQMVLHFNFGPNFFSVFFPFNFFKSSNWHVWKDSFNFIIKLQLLHFVLMNIARNYSNQLLWFRTSRRLIKTLSTNVDSSVSKELLRHITHVYCICCLEFEHIFSSNNCYWANRNELNLNSNSLLMEAKQKKIRMVRSSCSWQKMNSSYILWKSIRHVSKMKEKNLKKTWCNCVNGLETREIVRCNIHTCKIFKEWSSLKSKSVPNWKPTTRQSNIKQRKPIFHIFTSKKTPYLCRHVIFHLETILFELYLNRILPIFFFFKRAIQPLLMPSLLPNLFIFMQNEKKTDAILNEKSFFRLQVSEENLCGGFYLSFAFAKIKRSVDFKFAFSCSS